LQSYQFRDNRSMYAAIGFSVLAHAVLLAIRFVPPDAFRIQPADPGLEVILVNAKHAKAPTKAEALAQANLEGGGNAEAGRSKSPLPNLHRNETGEALTATERRMAELEDLQKQLLARNRDSTYQSAPLTEKDQPDPKRQGEDKLESTRAIARAEAELSERIEEQNKRPRKTYITPSTRAVGYAMYYNQMSKRIEDVGTLNFPQKHGKKLYGELVMMVQVFQDGSIYEKEGGLKVMQSSGNRDLDDAAKRIVRRAAPFGRFPANMRSTDKDDLWVVYYTFTFNTRNRLDLKMQGE
jgi:protein TonB